MGRSWYSVVKRGDRFGEPVHGLTRATPLAAGSFLCGIENNGLVEEHPLAILVICFLAGKEEGDCPVACLMKHVYSVRFCDIPPLRSLP